MVEREREWEERTDFEVPPKMLHAPNPVSTTLGQVIKIFQNYF